MKMFDIASSTIVRMDGESPLKYWAADISTVNQCMASAYASY